MEESFEDFSDLDTFSICRREDEEGESFAVFDQKGKKLGGLFFSFSRFSEKISFLGKTNFFFCVRLAVAVRLFQKFCRRVKHHPEDVYLKVDLSGLFLFHLKVSGGGLVSFSLSLFFTQKKFFFFVLF